MLHLFYVAVYTSAELEYMKLDRVTQLIYCKAFSILDSPVLSKVNSVKSVCIWSSSCAKVAGVTALLRRELAKMSSLSQKVLTL